MLIRVPAAARVVFLTSFLFLSCLPGLGQRLITTIAGGAIPDHLPASNVSLQIGGFTGDSAGNLYVTSVNLIYRISSNGIAERFAGTGAAAFGGDGGQAAAADFFLPTKLQLDRSGNLVILDSNNGRIRRIDRSGIVTTVAGTGISGSLGAGGSATSAQILSVADLAAGPDGTIYFSEPGGGRIRAVTADGRLILIAGAPQPSPENFLSDGDGGPAVTAHLAAPFALAADQAGNIYFADRNHAIRRIGPDGIINTIAGAGKPQVFTLGTGDSGPAGAAGFESIAALAADGQGNIYVVESSLLTSAPPPSLIRRISPDGIITTIAGVPDDGDPVSPEDGPALSIHFNASTLFVSPKGQVYFGDGARLRTLTPDGNILTIAGGSPQPAPDGPDARQAWLLAKGAMAVDAGGNIYVAEQGCRIRKVAPTGALSTVAGTGNCVYPPQEGPVAGASLPLIEDLAVTRQGVIYVSAVSGFLIRIQPGGSISVVQGVERPVTAPDNLSYPTLRLAVDSQDRIYALALLTQTVWRLSAGAPPEVFLGPGKGPSLTIAYAIATDVSDNVYIADHNVTGSSGRLFRISPTGTVTMSQLFPVPDSMAIDASGAIYSTVGGQLFGFGTLAAPRYIDRDGFLASSCRSCVSRITISRAGDFFVLSEDRVRKITGSPPSQAPTIPAAGIVNAASLVGGAVAPGELVSIFGTALGPATPWITATDNNFVPTVASNVRVFFNSIPAPITVSATNQINAFVPYGVSSAGTAQVVVEIDGVRSAPVTVNVANTAFGLFSADSSGAGQGAILNQDNSLNSNTHPADRGSVITLFGTGEGLTAPALPDGALVLSTPFSAPAGPVTVSIGGQTAEVLYAGAAPTLPTGVLQIDVRVPVNTTPGNAPVAFSLGGLSTIQQITVAVR